jgi:TRAP-type C4-dicarboxylate transport system substrate-binding protein
MRSFSRSIGLAFAVAASSTGAAAQETRLAMTSMSPAGSGNSIYFNEWAQRVNAASQGTLKVEVKDGVALASFANVYDRVVDDVAQIGWAIHQVFAGRFALTEVGGLPFVADDSATASLALWRLYRSGLLDAEYKDVVPLWLAVFPQGQVHYAKAPRTLDDLRGLKIGAAGRTQSQLAERMGGTAVSLQPGDYYEALQRGTIDAVITSWAAFAPYKLHEVSAYHLETQLGANTNMFFMARKKYEALPAAARKAIDDHSGEAQSRAFGAYLDKQAADQRGPAKASGKHTIVELSTAQFAAWEKNGAAPVLAEWAKGRPGGEKAISTYRALLTQAKAER